MINAGIERNNLKDFILIPQNNMGSFVIIIKG
jgi:hypothetical protein